MPTGLGPVVTGTDGNLFAARAEASGKKPRGIWPCPAKVTCCGLSALLSVMVRTALYATALTGLKVTVRSQETPRATLEPQAFVVRENSPGLVPVKVVLVMVRAEVPVLVNVVVKALVRPSLTVPKFKLAGTIFTVPLVTVTVAPADLVVSLTEVAVTVTVAGVGTPTGAVYVVGAPLNVLVSENVPHVDAHAAGGVP